MMLALLALAALNAYALEAPSKPIFQFNPKAGMCMSPSGLRGLNKLKKGECSDLWGADLQNAQLEKAQLAGANLARANLVKANLRNSNLQGANLMLANLENAELAGAQFSSRTILPFSREEAEKRGMVFIQNEPDKRVLSHLQSRSGLKLNSR
jgi:hypothetical protein